MQKGKFSAAADAFVSTLKKVDFLHRDKNNSSMWKGAISVASKPSIHGKTMENQCAVKDYDPKT